MGMRDTFKGEMDAKDEAREASTEVEALAPGHGRRADTPTDIPKPGWRDVLLRAKDGVNEHHLSLFAAGVAFYSLSALFPGIAALIAIWGLTFDPQDIQDQIATISRLLPSDAATIITDQAHKVATADSALSIGALIGFAIALYSAGAAVRALIEGLNVVYGEHEKRGFVRLNLLALALTVAFIGMLFVSLGLIAVVPAVLAWVGLDAISEMLISLLRWPLLFVAAGVGLAALYRYAPSREEPRWRWVSLGSMLATSLWVIASIGFSLYVKYFASYNETYGALGAVIILLMWFWLTAFIVLFGAQINAETEHQTAKDTTTGPPEPMGQRGAYVADTIGEEKK
jgi:membrane protein